MCSNLTLPTVATFSLPMVQENVWQAQNWATIGLSGGETTIMEAGMVLAGVLRRIASR